VEVGLPYIREALIEVLGEAYKRLYQVEQQLKLHVKGLAYLAPLRHSENILLAGAISSHRTADPSWTWGSDENENTFTIYKASLKELVLALAQHEEAAKNILMRTFQLERTITDAQQRMSSGEKPGGVARLQSWEDIFVLWKKDFKAVSKALNVPAKMKDLASSFGVIETFLMEDNAKTRQVKVKLERFLGELNTRNLDTIDISIWEIEEVAAIMKPDQNNRR